MMILLIPARPYPGLERMGGLGRPSLRDALKHVYDGRVDAKRGVHQFRTVDEFEKALDELGGAGACLYPIAYSRLGVPQRIGRFPVDLNPHPSIAKDDWLFRVHLPYDVTRELDWSADDHSVALDLLPGR